MTPARPKRTRLRTAAKAAASRQPSEACAAAIFAACRHKFKDSALLAQAFTHPSAVPAGESVRLSNQRLEFLGDRVLGLVMSEHLYTRRRQNSEGELAPLYNRLVKKSACAEAMRALALAPYLVLSESEETAGGRDRDSTLGDACEAIIGAIYLDGGLAPARRFIEAGWAAQFASGRGDARDPKSILQEWAQGAGLPLPEYSVSGRSGPDHSPHYIVDVTVTGHGSASGEGTSKREAERLAARALLTQLKVAHE